MQIACQRFSCQKAVEVCYWTCKFRRNCKDWQTALAGEPGLVLIQSRLEAAAAKTGRAFDAQTLASPVRKVKAHPLSPLASPRANSAGKNSLPSAAPGTAKEAAAIKVSVVSRPALSVQSNPNTRSDVSTLSRAQTAAPDTTETQLSSRKKKVVRRKTAQENQEMNESKTEVASEKAEIGRTKQPKPKPVRQKPISSGPVYLLLGANGKYKELREAELLTQAATLLKDPSLRLIKGYLLVPTISFKAVEE
jgi:hypothetical protein